MQQPAASILIRDYPVHKNSLRVNKKTDGQPENIMSSRHRRRIKLQKKTWKSRDAIKHGHIVDPG